MDFLKVADGRCWQTIEKRISIVESRGYNNNNNIAFLKRLNPATGRSWAHNSDIKYIFT